MSSPAKWIEFRPSAVQPPKTLRFDVLTKGGEKVGGVLLGRVQWWGRWRKYAFFPLGGTLYEPTCLRDIAAFIEAQMAERKAART